jgi:hypothetical protein
MIPQFSLKHHLYLTGTHTTLADVENPQDRAKLILVDHINKGRGKDMILDFSM